MRGPGLFSMLQFAAGLSIAGPMFFLGFEFARTGRIALGVGFFTLGAVVSYAPTYFLRRIGGPRAWIRRRLRRDHGANGEPQGWIRRRLRRDRGYDGDADDGSATDADDGSATDADGDGRYDRLRERFSRP